jgi:hypothetical protein
MDVEELECMICGNIGTIEDKNGDLKCSVCDSTIYEVE